MHSMTTTNTNPTAMQLAMHSRGTCDKCNNGPDYGLWDTLFLPFASAEVSRYKLVCAACLTPDAATLSSWDASLCEVWLRWNDPNGAWHPEDVDYRDMSDDEARGAVTMYFEEASV
jgi:hypothetical protein